MHVTDLDGRDGMLFRFGVPGPEKFWMKDTVVPLTAVWFAPDGRFLERDEMVPCPAGAAACPVYGPDAPVTDAIEFPAGRVDALGIGPGTTLIRIDPTADCPFRTDSGGV